MNNYGDFLVMLLKDIFSLPIKGIVYAELEFISMHLYLGYKAFVVGVDMVAPLVITAVAIVIMFASAFGLNLRLGHRARHGIGRVIRGIARFLWRITTALARSWYYMFYGACTTDDAAHVIHLNYGHGVTRVPINYWIGRAFYRVFRRLFGLIPFVRTKVLLLNGLAHTFAAVVAAVLLFWRIWYFPTDLGLW